MSCKVKSEAFVGRYYLAVEFLGGFCHKAALIQYTLREMPYNKPFGPASRAICAASRAVEWPRGAAL